MRLALPIALLASAAPVSAHQVGPAGGGNGTAPAPMTVQPLPGTTDADLLAAAMRRVGANSNDLAALLDAGDLSIRVGDLSAAAAFFARAERIDPRSGRAKAGEGAILVRAERPGEALRYFAMAESYGASVPAFASDRAWAYDLLGENERAQRDYRFALKAHPGEADTVRRYALSLSIAGKQKLALETLAPQIRAGDRTAWRDRAFIEAMGGDQAEAQRIATTMLPPGVSIGLLPFLRLLPSLGAADRAFAVHFGEVRATPERLADARLTPLLPALGPDPDAPQVAVAAVAAPRPERGRRPKRGRGVEVATREPAPEPMPPIPTYQGGAPGYAAAGYGVAQAAVPVPSAPVARPQVAPVRSTYAAPVQIAAIPPRPQAVPPQAPVIAPVQASGTSAAGLSPPVIARTSLAATAPLPSSSTIPPSSLPAAPPLVTSPARVVAALSTIPVLAQPPPLAAVPIAIGPAPLTAALAFSPPKTLAAQAQLVAAPPIAPFSPPLADTSGSVSASTAPSAFARFVAPPVPAPAPAIGNYVLTPPIALPSPEPTASAALAVSSPAAMQATQATPIEPVATPVAVPSAVPASAANALPASTILAMPSAPAPVTDGMQPASLAPPAPPAPSRADLPVPSPALTQLVAALPIPGAELGVGRTPPPAPSVAPDTSAADAAAAATRAALDQAARQAAAERVAKRAVAAKALADKRAAERKAAAEKQALADKKAAAEAKAEADRVAVAEKKAARANPSRIWVQVAGGASQADLPDAWAEAKAKAPDVYTGHATGWTTPLRATNRVLAGPFKTDAEARAFVNALAKKGASGFTFTSKAGQAIAKLPKE